MQITKTKAIPPPEGIGFKWELLSFGLSRKLTESIGIILDNNINVIIPDKKLTRNSFKDLINFINL